MRLFDRTTGYYLFWSSCLYALIGGIMIFSGISIPWYLAPLYLLVLLLPIVIPPFGRYMGFYPPKTIKSTQPATLQPKTQEPAMNTEPVKKQNEYYFTVGNTVDDKVILSVYGEDTTITLRMDTVATRRLIRLLESAIVEDDESLTNDKV